jgi:hypothetical protein
MMNMLVAAIRAKNKSTHDTGFILRPQYPQYVLYDVCHNFLLFNNKLLICDFVSAVDLKKIMFFINFLNTE